ncbi:glycosyltransferase [Desemzia incerta]|uniref:glycosyltransferase n=1 Tax=Desemzia incerta TaxID=82801 RepID=UPI003D0659B6
MEQKWVVFYVSSHGFGHMTRSLAVIEEIMKQTSDHVYLVSGAYQNGFARNYLKKFADRMQYKDLKTDIGLVTVQNGLTVDVEETEHQLIPFVASWENIVAEEVVQLKNKSIKCVLTDITPIGALVGKRLKVQTIGLSNFTWVEQYEFFHIQQEIIEAFKEAYSHLDLFGEYALALSMESVNCPRKSIGFLSRELDWSKISDLKQQYGHSLFISCGKAVKIDHVHIENYHGTVFTTSGITVTGSNQIIELATDTQDTHNYLAASDLVIAKAGWGTISEAITSSRKLVLIERESVLEDTHNIQQLKEGHLAISIKESELAALDIPRLETRADRDISLERLNQYSNQQDKVVELLGLK